VIDKQRVEAEKHRTAVRHRRQAIVRPSDEDAEGIVGVYAGYSEVGQRSVVNTRRANSA